MFDDILLETEEHFEKSIAALENEFRRIRTGRASPDLIAHVHVEAYGSNMPINQLATISVPEPTQLLIKPWDASMLRGIEKALVAADLDMTPQNDGEVIRLNVPPLSEERRKKLAAQAKEVAEKCRIAMRNSRRDGIKSIEDQGKKDKLSEDDVKGATEQVTELLKDYEKKVDERLDEKTNAILSM